MFRLFCFHKYVFIYQEAGEQIGRWFGNEYYIKPVTDVFHCGKCGKYKYVELSR